jgi:hypothetical protein
MAGSPLDVSPVELAAVLEEAASDIRALHFLYLDCSDQVRFRLGRQGPNEDRMRKAFEQIMSDYFQKHCRAKLRSEIGALTEIAFPGKEVNPDHVRDAMRSRPRKRRKRQRSR